MHRNDRMVISPDTDAHDQLANLQPDTLTQPKVVVWKPVSNPAQQTTKTLLTGDYATNAPEVSDAVRKVMTSVKPTPKPPTLRSRPRLQGPAPRSLAFIAQPLPMPRADKTTVVRTTAGVARKLPVNPDSLRRALGGNTGFVFEARGAGAPLRFQMLATQDDVDRENVLSNPAHPRLGSIFSHIWHSISSAAEDLYHDATKIVLVVADQISIAIHRMVDGIQHIVNVVVDSIEKAIDAVANFFEQLYLAIYDVILFLRALFDWDAIKGAQRLIRRMLYSIATMVADQQFFTTAKSGINSLFDRADELLGFDASGQTGSGNGMSQQNSGADDGGASSHANGVQARMPMHKMQDHGNEATSPGMSSGAVASGNASGNLIDDLINGLIEIGGQLMSLDLASMKKKLSDLMKTVALDMLDGARHALLDAIDAIANGFKTILDLLDTPLEIPFLSALYEWLFDGEKLSILNLVCLVVGLPIHIAFFLATRGRRFSNAGQNWLQAPPPASPTHLGHPLLGATALGGDSRDMEIVYVVIRILYCAASTMVDLTFVRGEETRLRGLFVCAKGVTGFVSSFLAYHYTMQNYQERLRQQAWYQNQSDDFLHRMTELQGTAWFDLMHALLSDGTGILLGAYRMYKGDEPASNSTFSTRKEYAVGIGLTLAAILQISLQSISFAKSREYGSDNTDSGLQQAAELLGWKVLMEALPGLFSLLYTQTTAGDYMKNEALNISVAAVRFSSNSTALVFHSAAAFDDLT
jgi:hypothetical protein